jgi:bidirectional [NiFe] hydrogenase diaphorase subunit
MPVDREPQVAAAKDNRWRLVEATMRRHGHRAHSLIESLHTAQESYGYLDPRVLHQLAGELRIPLSKVYGVATFYSFFTLEPQGEHTCVVCTGTACYIKGAGALLDGIARQHGVRSGETTGDLRLSVLTARCIGSCGLAPAAVLDGDVLGKLTVDRMLGALRERVGHDA